MTRWLIGVDTGGTFTDLAAVCQETQDVYVTKVPSTPGNAAQGIMDALHRFSIECDAALDQVVFLANGTTVATNAVLEGKGARVGLLLTRGYRAIYEMRGGLHPRGSDRLDPRYQKPRPLVPLALTYDVRERTAKDGSILEPLDEESVREAVRALRRNGVDSIAVVCLFSFMNPAHEERIAEIIREEFPGCRVSLSSRILPVIREYPRLSTTVLDAYVGPVVERYFHDLQTRAREEGLATQQFYIMQSNGGLMRVNLAARYPNQTLLSGPAAGVVFGAHLGQRTGEENIVTLDMGGTSTDISVIQNGTFAETQRGKVAGQDIGTPMTEIRTLGAGGGTIAWIDRDGLLKVGPQSAGADPGPACYSRGGTQPTVTDANVVLGYLDARRFLGGRMAGNARQAEESLSHVGHALGLDAVNTAIGVYRIVTTHMAVGLRLTLVEKGCDPSRFALVAFGGSGPVHAWRLAQDVGISRVLVPPYPGIGCAMGLLQTDVAHIYMQSYMVDLLRAPLPEVNERFVSLEQKAREDGALEGFSREEVRLIRQMDLRYPRQGYELSLDCPQSDLVDEDRAEIRTAFDALHERVYGIAAPDEPVEIVNVRVRSVVRRPPLELRRGEIGGHSPEAARRGSREAYFEELDGFVETPVYDRSLLKPGNSLRGPTIVEQLDATTVIGPGQVGLVDVHGNIVIQKAAEEVHR